MIFPPIKPADPNLMDHHPWWQAFNNCYTFDRYFRDDEHRKIAIASYMGLCTFVDELIGKVLSSLNDNGFGDTTHIAYISDHGDNMGARGLWGKSVMYEESVGVPMLLSGPDVPKGNVVRTPVSLVDMFPTILDGAGVENLGQTETLPGRSLFDIAREGYDESRTILSEYHGAAATSGALCCATADINISITSTMIRNFTTSTAIQRKGSTSPPNPSSKLLWQSMRTAYATCWTRKASMPKRSPTNRDCLINTVDATRCLIAAAFTARRFRRTQRKPELLLS